MQWRTVSTVACMFLQPHRAMRLAPTLSRAAAIAIATLVTSVAAAQPPATHPDPRLTPEEVVGAVLEALRTNDLPTPDRGIAVTFAFASPANRDATGTIEKFAALVRTQAYSPILNYRHVERGLLRVDGDEARERVVVTGADGTRAAFVFTLSRQASGLFKDCWMTDRVVRERAIPRQRTTIAD
jgi:hypothetical protein